MTDPSEGEEIYEVRGVRFRPRPGTTDLQAILECAQRRVYTGIQVPLVSGERWADVGANVGGFALYAAAQGCRVAAYEPVATNVAQLEANLQLNAAAQLQVCVYPAAVVQAVPASGTVALATPSRPDNQWRYTVMTESRPRWATEQVPAVGFAEVMERHRPHGVKLDAEGAELAIIDALPEHPDILDGVRYLVGELHLDVDPDLAAYHRRIDILRGLFDVVKAPGLPASGRFDKFPSGKVFRCWRS